MSDWDEATMALFSEHAELATKIINREPCDLFRFAYVRTKLDELEAAERDYKMIGWREDSHKVVVLHLTSHARKRMGGHRGL